jgi:hypothetical protein
MIDLGPTGVWSSVTSNTTADLRGVNGGPSATAGSSDIWAVGNGGIATYSSSKTGKFNAFVVAGNNTLAMTRVAYIDKGMAATITSSAVYFLTPTAGTAVSPQPSGGPFSGLTANTPPNPTVYLLSNQSAIYSFATMAATPMWSPLVSQAGGINGTNFVSGTFRGASFELWTAMSSNQEFYSAGSTWTFAGSLPAYNSVWAAPGPSGVYYVGNGGRIGYANITAAPSIVLAQNSNTTANLRDVAGTPDGQHIFAVGDGGKIIRCDAPPCMNGWTNEASGINTNLYGVWASATEVWAVGDGGLILHRSRITP